VAKDRTNSPCLLSTDVLAGASDECGCFASWSESADVPSTKPTDVDLSAVLRQRPAPVTAAQIAPSVVDVSLSAAAAVEPLDQCVTWGCSCQGFSNLFGTLPTRWGKAVGNSAAKRWWRAHKCATLPSQHGVSASLRVPAFSDGPAIDAEEFEALLQEEVSGMPCIVFGCTCQGASASFISLFLKQCIFAPEARYAKVTLIDLVCNVHAR
jgi:hypothetical protein